jgi:hypothetical protein
MSPILAIIGIITAFAAFGTNTAPEGTHNLGLLQQQLMTLHTGLALVIVAAILSLKGATHATSTLPTSEVSPDLIDSARDRELMQRKIWIAVLVIGVLAFIGLLFA